MVCSCVKSALVKTCGYVKATVYAIHPMVCQTVRKGATKEKKKYLNAIDQQDKVTGNFVKIVGVASAGMLCQAPVFQSFVDINAPGLLRAHQEDCLAVSLQEHKIGIIVKNGDL